MNLSKKMKKIVTTLLFVAIMMAPLFASTFTSTGGSTGTEKYTLDLSFIMKSVNLIVGVFAGGYVLLKAALDIFHAVRNSDQDPNGLKKAIGSLVLNVAILAGFMFVINYVFGTFTPDAAESAQTDFFSALRGALVVFK